jgi:hypothetical protein
MPFAYVTYFSKDFDVMEGSTVPTAPVSLFYSYAHEDENIRKAMGKHLTPAEHAGLIASWHDRNILPGKEWAGVIDEAIKKAELILLMVSPDFMASNYCWDVEMAYALDAHNRGLAVVVPIFVRYTDFSLAPFAKIQGLPRDARPITSWPDIDEPLSTIAAELRKLADDICSRRNQKIHSDRAADPQSDVERDAGRIKDYYKIFLRPAFSVPCIFESSLAAFKEARAQIARALGTGKVKLWTSKTITVAARSEFKSRIFTSALDQVSGFLSALERTVGELEVTLGKPKMESLIMEFHLLGLPKDRMKRAIDIMDQVDSERNAIIFILNHLFEYTGAPRLPEITLSSELIKLSAVLDKLGLQYSWPLYYFRTNGSILKQINPAEYRAFQRRKISDAEKKRLQEHIASVMATGIAEMWDKKDNSTDRIRGETSLMWHRRLQIALTFAAWRSKPTPELNQAIDDKLAAMGYPKNDVPKHVPAKDRELRKQLDRLLEGTAGNKRGRKT